VSSLCLIRGQTSGWENVYDFCSSSLADDCFTDTDVRYWSTLYGPACTSGGNLHPTAGYGESCRDRGCQNTMTVWHQSKPYTHQHRPGMRHSGGQMTEHAVKSEHWITGHSTTCKLPITPVQHWRHFYLSNWTNDLMAHRTTARLHFITLL